jgi:hypothetical protein
MIVLDLAEVLTGGSAILGESLPLPSNSGMQIQESERQNDIKVFYLPTDAH